MFLLLRGRGLHAKVHTGLSLNPSPSQISYHTVTLTDREEKTKSKNKQTPIGQILASSVMCVVVRNLKVRKEVIFSEDGCCQVIVVLLTFRDLKQLGKS